MNRTENNSSFAARLRDEIRRCSFGETPFHELHRAKPWAAEFPFAELALELYALQLEHNPAYRRLCEVRKRSRELASWTDIPTAPTTAFKELELTSLAPQERVAVFHSSGTTGQQPSRHFHSVESRFTYECSLLPWFQRHVLPEWGTCADFTNFLALTPSPALAPHSSLAHMFATVQREFGQREQFFVGRVEANGGWNVAIPGALEALERAVEVRRPLVLLGTAFSYVHLLDALAEAGKRIALPAGSRALETGGYKGRSRELPKPMLHALITERLGVPASHIICEYGMSELSSQAYDRVCGFARPSPPEVQSFVFPPWCRTMIVSPETGRAVAEGETGLLRLFDLANVWSVMAMQTEDLATRRGEGFELHSRARLSEPRGCSLMTT